MNSKRMIRMISISLSVMLLSSTFSGCKPKEQADTIKPTVEDTSSGYPLKTEKTLTYWITNSPTILNYATKADYPITKEWEKRTGVKIKWIFPNQGQELQMLNILLASADLPDMIEYYWRSFQGGPEKLMSDGYAAKLNELIDKNSPNLKKYLASHPDIDKMVKTDSGSYFSYPALAESGGDADRLLVTSGYMMRKDWLDELGLQVPSTIDEWHTVLKAFKEQKGAEAPFAPEYSQNQDHLKFLAGAFGAILDFYQEDGTVKYGMMGNSYKDFLITMNQWYQEGILDKNFPSLDKKMIDAKLLNGKTGATFGWLGSGMGTWLNAVKGKDPKFDLVGVPFPTKNKGDTSKFSTKIQPVQDLGVIITGNSKNKELAARFLDYGYGEEGHMFFNFGTENQSYTMVNGYPAYTDLILNNPDKLSINDAMALYGRGNAAGPFVQDKRYIEQYYRWPQQKAAQDIWMKAGAANNLPLLTPTGEESMEFAKIMSDVNSYAKEMALKFVVGIEPIDNYEKYVARMKQLGIERAVAIKQAAFDRYEKR